MRTQTHILSCLKQRDSIIPGSVRDFLSFINGQRDNTVSSRVFIAKLTTVLTICIVTEQATGRVGCRNTTVDWIYRKIDGDVLRYNTI